jgi:hypothetical protein
MGKGTIISGGSSGLYQVQINYNRARYDNSLARFEITRAALVSAAAEEDDPLKKALIELQTASVDKAIQYLEDNILDDITVAAWCADLTEDLAGEVGTVEVPGERGTLQIQPGYDGNAGYDEDRDGQIMPTISCNSAQAFYNLAMLPGWQKWQPTFRYATIDSIAGDQADVTLEAAASSQQGLDVNQEQTLVSVAIEYLNCDGVAFGVGDEVLVKFEGQDFAAPKIVGFKDNPQPCGGTEVVIRYRAFETSTWYCFIWNLTDDEMAEGNLNNGDPAVFPVRFNDVSNWLAGKDWFFGSPLDTEALPALAYEYAYFSNEDMADNEDIGVCCAGLNCNEYTNINTEFYTDPGFLDADYSWNIYIKTVGTEGIIEHVNERQRDINGVDDAFDSWKIISKTNVAGSDQRKIETSSERTLYVDPSAFAVANCGAVNPEVNAEYEAQCALLNSISVLLPELIVNLTEHSQGDSWDHQLEAGGAVGTKFLVGHVAEYLTSSFYNEATVGAYTDYMFDVQIQAVVGEHATNAADLDPLALPKHVAISAEMGALKQYTDDLAGAVTIEEKSALLFQSFILE